MLIEDRTHVRRLPIHKHIYLCQGFTCQNHAVFKFSSTISIPPDILKQSNRIEMFTFLFQSCCFDNNASYRKCLKCNLDRQTSDSTGSCCSWDLWAIYIMVGCTTFGRMLVGRIPVGRMNFRRLGKIGQYLYSPNCHPAGALAITSSTIDIHLPILFVILRGKLL